MLQEFDSKHVIAWLSWLSQISKLSDAHASLKTTISWLKVSPSLSIIVTHIYVSQEQDAHDICNIFSDAEQMSLQFITDTLSNDKSLGVVFSQIIGAIATLEEPFTPHELDKFLSLKSG